MNVDKQSFENYQLQSPTDSSLAEGQPIKTKRGLAVKWLNNKCTKGADEFQQPGPT